MPISLHPSGYAVEYAANALENLTTSNGGFHPSKASKSRRGRFYDAVSCLNAEKGIRLFLTFTIPPQQTNFKETDIYYSGQFSKLLELLKVNYKRGKKGKGINQYVWVAESQHRGNLHWHLLTNTPRIDIQYIQQKWDNLVNNGKTSCSFDVQKVSQSDVRNVSAYFAKYMSKSIATTKEKNQGLKNRVIFSKTFHYSKGFQIEKPVQLSRAEFLEYIDHVEGTKKKIIEYKDKTQQTKKFEITEYYLQSELALHLCKNFEIEPD